MERINFVNNETKASAETFNLLQDNIENAIEDINQVFTNMKNITLSGDRYAAFKPSGSYPMVIIPIFNPANSNPTTNFTSITIYDDTGNWVNCTVEAKTYTKTQLVLTLNTSASTTSGKCYIVRLQGNIICE